MAAAFEKVWHKGMAAKFEQNGITESCLDLFKSYLSNRKQIVVVDGVKSHTEVINAGIPQGSRLGPLLFIIYINDIVKDLESDIFIFADDTTLSCSHKNATKTSEILNRDLNRISIWSKKWKVTFQPSKTKFILFSQNKVDLVPPLTFDDKVIKQVNSHKHLGFYLTYNLDWSEQLNYLC